MKILVLGASGMLGSRLVPYLVTQGHEVLSAGRGDENGLLIDLRDKENTLSVMRSINPDVVVNLVGMTDVERCESHPKEAWLANVQTAENIVYAGQKTGSRLVHLSTDQVYDSVPNCLETDASPGNYYALTKYAGELKALQAGATVLRTNFFGVSRHPTRRSLTDWLFSVLKESRPTQVFNDVHFSPLNMDTLCAMINEAIKHRHSGIFNLGSRDGMSKADFAFAFANATGLSSSCFSRVSAAQSGLLKAWRPKSMCMNSSQFETIFSARLPSLQTEIEHAAKEYRA